VIGLSFGAFATTILVRGHGTVGARLSIVVGPQPFVGLIVFQTIVTIMIVCRHHYLLFELEEYFQRLYGSVFPSRENNRKNFGTKQQ
jgi:hypothetical protein